MQTLAAPKESVLQVRKQESIDQHRISPLCSAHLRLQSLACSAHAACASLLHLGREDRNCNGNIFSLLSSMQNIFTSIQILHHLTNAMRSRKLAIISFMLGVRRDTSSLQQENNQLYV